MTHANLVVVTGGDGSTGSPLQTRAHSDRRGKPVTTRHPHLHDDTRRSRRLRTEAAGRLASRRCKWTPAAVWRDALSHPFAAQLTFLYRHAPLVVPLVRPLVQSKAATNRRAHVLTLAGAVPGRNHSGTESRGIRAGVDRPPRGKVYRPRKAS